MSDTPSSSVTGYMFAALLVVGSLWLVTRLVEWVLLTLRRRAMIKENGCQKPYAYQNKGFLGKLLGIDLVRRSIKGQRAGAANATARITLYEHGNKTISFRVFSQPVICTIEPENIKTMLSVKFKEFILPHERKRVFWKLFGRGIFSTDGAQWEHSRALIRPNFTRAQVADLDMFERHLEHVINAIPRDGSTVDLQDLFFALTMDSATEFLFGTSTNTLSPTLKTKEAEDFVEAYVWATEDADRQLRKGPAGKWLPNAKFDKAVKVVHDFADRMIAEEIRLMQSGELEKVSKEKQRTRYVFLHELLKQTQDPYTLRSEVLNVLLAGRDTTAGLLANMWHTLSKRPDIFAKLRTEVQEKIGQNRPDYTNIKEMTYLKYVLNETLRLMPSVPGNSREAACDTVLPLGGGPDGRAPIFVPKGTIVGYQAWSMHRREDFYGDDAMDFKPERWATLRPGWEYLPFNGGPRICIGQQYALMEASYTTIRLIQTFPRMESRDPRPWKEWQAITLASGVGCKVAMFEK